MASPDVNDHHTLTTKGGDATMHRSILMALASGCIVGGWQAASAAETAPALTLEIAQKMVAGCQAKATEKGWRVNIAIVDSGANLVMFERVNGAPLGSVTVAQHKAETSAKWLH
jgi:glc operon protein GlcG